jgi:hypothetical protein
MQPDLDARRRTKTTPSATEVVSYSARGDKFLRDWVDPDDRPTRSRDDGRLFVILFDNDVERLLIAAAKAGLEF